MVLKRYGVEPRVGRGIERRPFGYQKIHMELTFVIDAKKPKSS